MSEKDNQWPRLTKEVADFLGVSVHNSVRKLPGGIELIEGEDILF